MFFPVNGDPYWTSVSALLPMTGANDSTTFTDLSPTTKTVTAYGNAKISTAKNKWGISSGYFDGSGDYLQIDDHVDFQLGSENFTIECWIYISGYAANNNGYYTSNLVGKDVSGSREFTFYITGTSSSFDYLVFIGFSDNFTYVLVNPSASFSLETWHHVAACRYNNRLYLFKNGVLLNAGGDAFSITLQATNTPVRIGAQIYGGGYDYYYNGYVQDVRITKGQSRYTADFAVPTGPLSPHPSQFIVGRSVCQPSAFETIATGL